MTSNNQFRLTRVIKRVLDVLLIFVALALVVWPLAVFTMGVGSQSHSDTWGVDISVYAGFELDLSKDGNMQAQSPGVRDPIIDGRGMLGIDTSSVTALLVSAVLIEFGGIIALYILLQLRSLFASLVGGAKFTAENATRIQRSGIALTGWAVLKPILQYFGGQAVLNEYALQSSAVRLYPVFEVDGITLFIGLSLLILAGVLSEARQIHDEQQLTI